MGFFLASQPSVEEQDSISFRFEPYRRSHALKSPTRLAEDTSSIHSR